MSYRNGGEVYVRDLPSKTTRRLTFDSPGAPRAKVFPVIAGDLVTRGESGDGLDPNPSLAQYVYANSKAQAKLDLVKKERCRSEKASTGGFGSLHGRHLHGYRSIAATKKTYLVDIDLDSPDLEWKCDAVP